MKAADASPDAGEVPEGFELIHEQSPFLDAFGQLYLKRKPQGAIIGLRVARHHLNRYGNLHGGALSGFLDVAMGLSILLQPGAPAVDLTVSLNVDFVEPGSAGDWLEADVSIPKMGRRLAFAHCEVRTPMRTIARASGVWM